ncbi:HDOD domain-containing protein [Proteinivorax hydrogeniformans]|uniref:HDOD domain-containing protein n=1 Tax=Proteinivorax hydrogeniformans TaxID=1826727 RepID=A0AAU8HVE5_9FIRM
MDVYVARQPIFNRGLEVYGYELLYRRSLNNFYEGEDDSKATAELINNAFLVMELNDLTDGTYAFINFSQEMLEQEIPFLLDKEKVVIEVLERVEVSDRLLSACKKLREQGYIIALDDFVLKEENEALIEVADIIKMEFSGVNKVKQQQLIGKYGNKLKFLAEKIETREEFQQASSMGYHFFQGYFFSKPAIKVGKEIDGFNANLLRILNELDQKEPDYQKLTNVIETDLGLSYKLLKLANSVFFSSRFEIKSIRQALVRMGISEIKKWVYLLMLKRMQGIENKELVKNCLVRAKLMEFIATEFGKNNKLDFFMTGMFSSIDVLLKRDMEEILQELPFNEDVKNALLGTDNQLRQSLKLVLEFEQGNWGNLEESILFKKIPKAKFMERYTSALQWAKELEYLDS